MTERPILFSAPMVRALLAGQKTQTRRVVKLRGAEVIDERGWQTVFLRSPWPWSPEADAWVPCPYGAPGDRLWVRETWRVGAWRDDGRMALDFAASPDLVRTPWLKPPREAFRRLHVQGLADCRRALARGALSLEEHSDGRFTWPHGGSPCRWRPSIHMPRWASRLTLEVTGVRVERLQAISEEDARAEGVDCPAYNQYPEDCPCWRDEAAGYKWHFRTLWESINGADSWASNPWVWAISFRRVTR